MNISNKEKKEINKRIAEEERYLAACQDSAALIASVQYTLPILKKSLRKMYPNNEDSKNLCLAVRTIMADLSSMKAEIETLASDTGDVLYRLEKSLEEDTQGAAEDEA